MYLTIQTYFAERLALKHSFKNKDVNGKTYFYEASKNRSRNVKIHTNVLVCKSVN